MRPHCHQTCRVGLRPYIGQLLLQRLNLVLEDFPQTHNLVLIAQPELISKLNLRINDDLRSRVTYSVLLQKLAPDDAMQFILRQLDKVALGHNTFTDDALGLIARSSEGGLRRIRNLCTASMVEAVRDRTLCDSEAPSSISSRPIVP